MINLKDNYAQSHPDEDFAETFAVWLQYSRNTWERKYLGWSKALEKLRYVDRVMSEVKDQATDLDKRTLFCRASRLTTSLEVYYQQKKERLRKQKALN